MRYDFYVKTQFRKNHVEEGKNSLFLRGYSELSRAILCLQSLLLFSLEGPVYIYPTRCNKGADIKNLQNSRICTLGFLQIARIMPLIVVSDPRCRL